MTDVELEILVYVLRREDSRSNWDNDRLALIEAAKRELLKRIRDPKGGRE